MRVLFLAPQPFFQERGTPIAVRLALQVLSEGAQRKIDLLCYHEGETVAIPGVDIYRIWAPRFLRNIGPGISLSKLLCDVIFAITAFKLIWSARRNQYALVHAVEESVFVALVIKWLFRIPYLYDMDSSLSMQLTEKWLLLRPLRPLLSLFERIAIRSSVTVVPVCDALAAVAQRHGVESPTILRDVSLLNTNRGEAPSPHLRTEASISRDAVVVMYIGNLESYQGIDLLLESFALLPNDTATVLVIIGGQEKHIEEYSARASALGISSRVRFLGPRPVGILGEYLAQADVLVSPRTKGNNTPMKIYSYLHSGKPVVATALPTHLQVLDSTVAQLSEPTPEAFATALQEVIESPDRRAQLGAAARQLVEERYTFEIFSSSLQKIYADLADKIRVPA